MSAAAPAATAVAADRKAGLLTPVLFLVTLVVAVISSLGAPLIPLISTDLHVSLSDAQWSLTAALLAGAVSAPIMGRLGDGAHRREAIAAGLAVVTLGGVLAAVATSLPILVVGRAMQGVGLGLIPLAMAAARDGLPGPKVAPAIALLSVSAAAGVGVGYPVSGLIAEHLGLHAAYWFGAGFAAISLVAVLAIVPRSTATSKGRLDVSGALLLSTGLIALLLAIGQGTAWGWGSTRIVALLIVAAVLIVAWAPLQLRTTNPLIELRLLRHPAVLTADASAFVLGAAMYIDLSVVTAFVQTPRSTGYGFGASVLTAGLCLVPFSITSLLASRALPLATRVLGPRGVLPVGCLTVAAAGALFALGHHALWEAFAIMAIVGVGLGFTFAAIPGLIVRSVPEEETGSAMGFYQVVRYIGFSIGSALAASILAAHTPHGAHLPTETGFETALWVGAGLCVAAALTAWLVPGRTPSARPSEELERYETEDAELGTAGVIGLEDRIA
ncbi:MAG: transporter [Conexibacter sp.]|nr:transporter [Conexibacter sp.]